MVCESFFANASTRLEASLYFTARGTLRNALVLAFLVFFLRNRCKNIAAIAHTKKVIIGKIIFTGDICA